MSKINERIQRTFTLSFNSKISSDMKMLDVLQKLPRGYGKRLIQDLIEEKFGRSNSENFEKKILTYLGLDDFVSDSKEFIDSGIKMKMNNDNEIPPKNESSFAPKKTDSLEF